MAYYLGSTYDRQSRRAVISQDDGQLLQPLPILLSQDAVNPGAQSLDLPPAYSAPRRARDYSFVETLFDGLTGTDAVNPGDQSVELPPRAAARARDYTFEASFPPVLIGADALPTGDQALELPPRGTARSRDYTLLQSASLPNFQEIPFGQSTASTELPPRAAPRSRDYTFEASTFPGLIGTDAMVAGRQLSGNAPAGRPRATSLPEVGVNLTAQLDAIASAASPAGQSTAPTELAPRAAPRARDYTIATGFPQELIGQDALPTGQSTADTEIPPRAPSRSRDYTWAGSFPLELIAQDRIYGDPGQTPAYDWPNPRLLARRVPAAFEPGVNLTLGLAQVIEAIPYGQQSTDNLPPRASARARDYTYLQQTQGQLIGQDAMAAGSQSFALPPAPRPRASSLSEPGTNYTIEFPGSLPPGQQSEDLPPRAQPRARDYTQIDRLPNLIGQDATNAGKSTDATALPPRGPARQRDYTWLQSMPLHIYQQLPPGASTALTESPPRGPLRSRDYTYLDLTRRHLIGQDVMYGAPGEVPAYDWQLPTPPRKRMQDYTLVQRFDLSQIAAQQRPGMHTLTDREAFAHTLSDRALFVHTLTDSVAVV